MLGRNFETDVDSMPLLQQIQLQIEMLLLQMMLQLQKVIVTSLYAIHFINIYSNSASSEVES